MQIRLLGFQCQRCGHQWRPRTKTPPVRCPSCKSPYWNRPRRKELSQSLSQIGQAFRLVQIQLGSGSQAERFKNAHWIDDLLAAIEQGLEGLLAGQSKILASGLKKLSQIFNEAKTLGDESPIWEVIDLVAQTVPDDLQPQLGVFRTALRSITDVRDGADWVDELAQVYTTPPGPVAGTPAHQVAEGLRGLTWPDPEFADDLEAIQASQPVVEEPIWPN
jgi:DNA-directed RNA polymerase subunit RPC12/RpoP